jgi:hypothetical protein
MPELPIHPGLSPEAPGYSLARRLARLGDLPEEIRRSIHELLREAAVRETLRLTGGATDPAGPLYEGSLQALLALETAASSGKELDLTLVREIHRLSSPPSSGDFRTGDLPAQFRNARALAPKFIEARLQNLLDWLHGESGRSMFPAERMALWFPRFLEIAPFERGNFRCAHLCLSFFSCAAGFPPVHLKFEEAEEVRGEIERAILFDTGALVQRFSAVLGRALDGLEAGKR